MKMLLAVVFAFTSVVASAEETKTSPWSLKLVFDNYTNRDESELYSNENHPNYKRLDGFQTDIFTTLGYKLNDKNSFSLTNLQTYQNRRSANNERGAWLSDYLTYNRSGLLAQDSQFLNLSGFVRLYRHITNAVTWDRNIQDITPYVVRTGVSMSRDFGGIFGLALDPYFQWYIRETGVTGTKKWRIAYSLTPSLTINDMWSASAPVMYYYTRQIVDNKSDKTKAERTIVWEFQPTVSTVWTKSLSTDAYYMLSPVAGSHDGKSGLARKATAYNSSYGLTLNVSVF